MRNGNAMVAWIAISAGVQDLLASFSQSLTVPYQVLNKKFNDLLPTFYRYVPSNYYCFSTVYCSKK